MEAAIEPVGEIEPEPELEPEREVEPEAEAVEPVAQVIDMRHRKLTRSLQRCHITVGEEIL